MQNSILDYCEMKEKARKEKQTKRMNRRTNKHKKSTVWLSNIQMYT